jgi:pyruvate,phosphate dikinase
MLFFDNMSVSDFCENEEPKIVLGGKGAGLAEMSSLGVSVPPFVVIPTELCREYMSKPKTTMSKVIKQIPIIQKHFIKQFGYLPLVSVRSGARVSCPGMMDTILNVGLDTSNLEEWESRLGYKCTWDSYSRLIQMYGNVVKGIPREQLAPVQDASGDFRLDLTLEQYEQITGTEFPNGEEQWATAIEAVFKSWNNDRAKTYRKLNNIPDDWGTAVVIQSMVFGNLNDQSCTGVLFTRNPSNGEAYVSGEFLVNAQGEDVVAGIRTPEPLLHMMEWDNSTLTELLAQVKKLEQHFRDMQDVEFTVQEGKLYILQTRNAKRTAKAAIRIAVDLTDEGLLTPPEACKRVTAKQWYTAIKPVIDPAFDTPPNGQGIPASGGIARGMAVFSSQAAVDCKSPCILISHETTPDDIVGMNASAGILTAIGGATSHAAVVARGMDRTCVVGCTDLKQDSNKVWFLNGKPIKEGDTVTLDGDTGRIWLGITVPVVSGESDPYIAKFAEFAESQVNALPLVTADEPIPNTDCWYLARELDEIDLVAPQLQGYMDIRDEHQFMPPAFLDILLVGGKSLGGDQVAKANRLIQGHSLLTLDLKFKIVASDQAAINLLREAGYQVVPTVCHWEHLLDVEDEAILVLPEFNHRAQQVLKLREAAKMPLVTVAAGSEATMDVDRLFLSKNQMLRRALG